jgi:hypothetical protein
MGQGTGGGWMNGRGDDRMTMFKGYAHMAYFFISFERWKADLHDELVKNDSFCFAEPGCLYVIYMDHRGSVNARLEPCRYKVKRFNPGSLDIRMLRLRTDLFGHQLKKPTDQIG